MGFPYSCEEWLKDLFVFFNGMTAVDFFKGIVFGSLLGVCINFFEITRKIFGITPDIGLLTAIAGFYASIISFLIPISINFITRISEQYPKLARRFEEEPINRFLPKYVVINLIFVGFLLLIVRIYKPNQGISILHLLAYILFFYGSLNLLRFLFTVKKYITSTKHLENQLFEQAREIIE